MVLPKFALYTHTHTHAHAWTHRDTWLSPAHLWYTAEAGPQTGNRPTLNEKWIPTNRKRHRKPYVGIPTQLPGNTKYKTLAVKQLQRRNYHFPSYCCNSHIDGVALTTISASWIWKNLSERNSSTASKTLKLNYNIITNSQPICTISWTVMCTHIIRSYPILIITTLSPTDNWGRPSPCKCVVGMDTRYGQVIWQTI